MNIPTNIEKVLLLFMNNLDNDSVIYTGSICDYINYKKKNLILNVDVLDIDMIILNKQILSDIEKLFNVKAKFITNNNEFKNIQYFIYLIDYDVNIDIFVQNDLNNVGEVIDGVLFNKKVKLFSPKERFKRLNITFKYTYGRSYFNKKILKYLKKIILYKKIIS